ncbi:hypothetical protein [Yoonia sp.]
MTILLLVTMLILGGMAVDFMRYEARRCNRCRTALFWRRPA